jgi:putative membrane protein
MENAPKSTGSVAPGAAAPAGELNLALTQSQFSWIRTRLGVERTILAWTRTGVSLIGFGFTIYQFFQRLQEATAPEAARPQAPRNFGLALIGAGVVALGLALWQHRSLVNYLRGPEFSQLIPDHTALPFKAHQSVWVTSLLTLIGIVAFLWILFRG